MGLPKLINLVAQREIGANLVRKITRSVSFSVKHTIISIITLGVLISQFGQYANFEITPKVSAATDRQIPFAARIIDPGTRTVVADGTYTIRFAIYSADRTVQDPYPSDTDTGIRLWSETKDVVIRNGIISTMLGTVVALPGTINFASNDLYFGIRVNADPEMVPRRQIGSVAHAITADNIAGKEIGTGANNIIATDAAGSVKVTNAPPASTTASLLQLGSSIVAGSASGTYLGVNAATGFAGDLMNLQVDGTTKLKVDATGAVTTGVWQATTIGATYGGTGLNTYATGDLLYASNATTLARLPIGANGLCLTSNGTTVGWGPCVAAGALSLQGVYDGGNTITTTNARDLSITLANTATDPNMLVNIASGSTGRFAVQGNGVDVFGVSASGTTITSGGLNLSSTGITSAGAISGVTAVGASGTISSTAASAGFTANSATASAFQATAAPAASATSSIIQLGAAIADGSASGTYIGINAAAGYAGNFVDLQVNGASMYKVTSAGAVSSAGPLTITTSTSPQLSLCYDASNCATAATSATGALTLAPKAGQNLNVELSTTGDLVVNTSQLYLDTSTGNVGLGTITPQRALSLSSSKIIGIEMATPSGVTATPAAGGSLVAGTYYFKVVGVDTAGNTSLPSAEASCTVDGVATASCNIAWAVSLYNVSTYRVYKGVGPDAEDRYKSPSGTGGVYYSLSWTTDTSATMGSVPTINTAMSFAIGPAYTTFGGQGWNSIAIGYGATARGDGNIAIGKNATTDTVGKSIAIGGSTSSYGSVAIGSASTGIYGVVVGVSSSAAGDGSTVLGSGSGATDNAIAIGRGASAGNAANIAIGFGMSTNAAGQILFGNNAYDYTYNVYIGKGITHATPRGFVLNATGGSGTDIAGGSLTIAGGKGTGAGVGGDVIISTSAAGASGTTLRSLVEHLRVSTTGNTRLTSTTSPQLSVKYDGSNYYDTSVSSAGAVSFDATGTSAGFTFADTLTASNGLTVSASGASITGGINNNNGGITNTGAISGATTIAASGTISSTAASAAFTANSATATAFQATAAPAASATSSVIQLGSAIAGGSANGTYLGINTSAGFAGNFADFQVNGASKFSIDASGNLIIAGTFTGPGTGALGYWTRTGTELTPATANDTVSIISTTSPQMTVGYDGSNKLTYGVSSTGAATITVAGTTPYIALAGGNVTIGGTSPQRKFDIASTLSAASTRDGLLTSDNILYSSLYSGQYIGKLQVTENQFYISNFGDTWVTKGGNYGGGSILSDIALSSNGKYQLMNAGPAVYVSSNYGSSWTTKAGVPGGGSVAISADGNIQAVSAPGSQLYVSTNFGSSFTARDSARNWQGIAMSADGKIMAATVNSAGPTEYVYVSTDFGVTWVARGGLGYGWTGIAMSSDGKIMTGHGYNGGTYVSTNYGTSWSYKSSAGAYNAQFAMSANGKIQSLTQMGGNIYVSTDYGSNWTAKASALNWLDITMSESGMVQAALLDSHIYISTDYGNTWTEKSPSTALAWYRISMSSDGKVIAAVHTTGSGYVTAYETFATSNTLGAIASSSSLTIAGAISGATTISASGTISTTAASAAFTANSATATALQATAAPAASATSSIIQLGAAIVGGSASGTYIGINAAAGYAGNFVDFQVNGTSVYKITSAGGATMSGTLTVSAITSTGALAISSAANNNINLTVSGTGNVTLGDGGVTNYSQFDANGALTFAGAARPYSEIVLIPDDAVIPAANGCPRNQTDATNFSYFTVDCDPDADEWANWQFKMPQNYVNASNIQVDIYWEANDTSGAAKFNAGYVAVASGEAYDAASRTDVAGTASATAGTAYYLNTTTMTLTTPSIEADDMVTLRILRDADDGTDTLTVDAKIIKVRVKFLVGS